MSNALSHKVMNVEGGVPVRAWVHGVEMEAEAEPEVASRFGPSRFLPSGECQAVSEAFLFHLLLFPCKCTAPHQRMSSLSFHLHAPF